MSCDLWNHGRATYSVIWSLGILLVDTDSMLHSYKIMFDVGNQMQLILLLRFHHFVNKTIYVEEAENMQGKPYPPTLSDQRMPRQDVYHIDYLFSTTIYLEKQTNSHWWLFKKIIQKPFIFGKSITAFSWMPILGRIKRNFASFS